MLALITSSQTLQYGNILQYATKQYGADLYCCIPTIQIPTKSNCFIRVHSIWMTVLLKSIALRIY